MIVFHLSLDLFTTNPRQHSLRRQLAYVSMSGMNTSIHVSKIHYKQKMYKVKCVDLLRKSTRKRTLFQRNKNTTVFTGLNPGVLPGETQTFHTVCRAAVNLSVSALHGPIGVIRQLYTCSITN